MILEDRIRKWIIALAALIILLLVLVHINYRRSSYLVIDGFAQGTTYHIIYIPDLSIDFLLHKDEFLFQDEIDSLLRRIDESLSLYHPESIITRINRNDSLVIADELFETVFRKAVEVSAITDGAFDITVGPVVNAWGFGPGERERVDSAMIDSLLQYVGMEKVSMVGDRVVKSLDGVLLDLNAIAQGYSVDLLARFFENRGIDRYLVELGGEVSASGLKNAREQWKIGVDKPIDNNLIPGRELQVIVSLYNRSLATSGNYRKFYVENGVKYSHTIDPATGYPVTHNLLSATIVANDCMTADAFATACMVMGLEKSIDMISQLDELDAFFIYSGNDGAFETWATEGFLEMIEERSSER